MDADRLAPWYRWVEYVVFGRSLERARFALLQRLERCSRILVLGEGDGRTLERLLRIAPDAQFDVIESSARMIALAKARVGPTDRVRYFCQDVLRDPLPSGAYDGIVTCFFLDCFTDAQLTPLLQKIRENAAPRIVWVVSEFAIPEQGLRRWHARGWIWVMYRFFHFATALEVRELPQIESALARLGLSRTAEVHQRWGLIVAQVWEAQGLTIRKRTKTCIPTG